MTRLQHLQGRLARRARWTAPLSHVATLAEVTEPPARTGKEAS